MNDVRYLVFDVESVADGELVAKLKYPREKLAPAEAIARFRAELLRESNNKSDFIPYTFQLPVAVVAAKVSPRFELLDVAALDAPEFRPHKVTQKFWQGWRHYERPTLVSFNGRSFDVPLLELAAFRFGFALADWFQLGARSFEQPRNRYNLEAHLDLHDVLTNFGASRFVGGLNLAANILGKPGKMEVQGHMVQDMYNAGRLAEINDYCRCDVLDTYFVFLRVQVLLGELSLEREQELVTRTKQWIRDRALTTPAYRAYLESWGDWQNPWGGTNIPEENSE